jgi:hypothetical protein
MHSSFKTLVVSYHFMGTISAIILVKMFAVDNLAAILDFKDDHHKKLIGISVYISPSMPSIFTILVAR